MKKQSVIFVAVVAVILLFILLYQHASEKTASDSAGASPAVSELQQRSESPEISEEPALSEAAEIETEFTEGVRIKKYPGNTACFLFETPDKYQIVCDPYLIDDMLQPDVVTESHQDLDHSDTAILVQPYELIKEAGDYTFGDINIKGYEGKHNKGTNSINNIFVFDINGIKIAHFASQGEVPGADVLDQIGTVDVLLIQAFVNPNYNKLVYQDVDTIIEKLNPKIIIPEHGDTNAGATLAKRLNSTEEIEASGIVIITRAMLDDVDGIRVINLDN